MNNIIDTGLVGCKLPFDRGTEEIFFNPNDTEFFSRVRRMFDRIGEIYKKAQEEYAKESIKTIEQLEISENANNEIKKEVDIAFGNIVSDKMFKYCSPTSFVKSQKKYYTYYILEYLLELINKEIGETVSESVKEMQKISQKYASKFQR